MKVNSLILQLKIRDLKKESDFKGFQLVTDPGGFELRFSDS